MCVCVCLCVRNLLVNALVINVWALLVFCSFHGTVNVRGFVLMFLFKGKCMKFLCANQSKFTRFGCWLTIFLL